MSGRIGVVGGGQLALMLAEAARPLGVELHVQTPKADDPATRLATSTVLAPLMTRRAHAPWPPEAMRSVLRMSGWILIFSRPWRPMASPSCPGLRPSGRWSRSVSNGSC